MTYRAVVFDLFGTLVENTSFVGSPSAAWQQRLMEMATIVGADPTAFTTVWSETSSERAKGTFPTVEACVQNLCERLGVRPNPEQVGTAAAIRIQYMRSALVPRPDAVATLQKIRAQELRIGLISNCIPDVPLLWDATALARHVDVPIFSAAVRLPDPCIYQLTCEQLGVAPEECLFIADGEGGELAGAASIGMTPILIRCSYDDPPGHRRPHVEPWEGGAISWLTEILSLINPGQAARE